MASPLNCRILNHQTNDSSMSLSTRNIKVIASSYGRGRKRISGYSVDGESISLHATSLDKQMRADHIEAHAKKRKTEENNYQALNARNDVKNTEISPSSRISCQSRVLSHESIDLSTVDLITVSKNRPYIPEKYNSEINETNNHCIDSAMYIDLLEICRPFYALPGGSTHKNISYRSVSTPSSPSMTDSDTNTYTSPPKLVDLPTIGEEFILKNFVKKVETGLRVNQSEIKEEKTADETRKIEDGLNRIDHHLFAIA